MSLQSVLKPYAEKLTSTNNFLSMGTKELLFVETLEDGEEYADILTSDELDNEGISLVRETATQG